MRENANRNQSGLSSKFTTRDRLFRIFCIIYRRYIWEAYKKGEISRQVYDYCIKNKLADQNLIAMWKKVGQLVFA